MTRYTLSPRALGVIQNYLHLPFSQKDVSCPYYNNRRSSMRAGLRVLVGKGSVDDIVDEATLIALREKINFKELDNVTFKKFLVDRRIGIDCSGLAYYILDAESVGRNFGHLREHLTFPYVKNFVRKIIAKLRPIENVGVTTFAHEKNSREIALTQVMPGDYIVILYTGAEKTYSHIVVVHQVDYEGDPAQVTRIYYTHSYAWPTDGQHNHGVGQGTIDITDPTKPITEQLWTEHEKTGSENYTREKAREAMYVSVRRLNWF